MTLTDLCEPVFQSLCRLGRRHKAGDAPPSRAVREEFAHLLTDARARASMSPALLSQFDRAEPAIILCIDRAVRASGWPCARHWSPRASIGPDDDADRFFALLRQTLDDPSEAADERLGVLAACAALAFVVPGLSEADRESLDQLRLRLAIDSPLACRPAPPMRREDLTRPSPLAAILVVALALALLALGPVLLSRHDAAARGGGLAGATP